MFLDPSEDSSEKLSKLQPEEKESHRKKALQDETNSDTLKHEKGKFNQLSKTSNKKHLNGKPKDEGNYHSLKWGRKVAPDSNDPLKVGTTFSFDAVKAKKLELLNSPVTAEVPQSNRDGAVTSSAMTSSAMASRSEKSPKSATPTLEKKKSNSKKSAKAIEKFKSTSHPTKHSQSKTSKGTKQSLKAPENTGTQAKKVGLWVTPKRSTNK